MSKWGVIQSMYDDHNHVLPVDDLGDPLGEHVISMECNCKPRRDKKDWSLIIHNDKEKGGFNS